VGIERDEVLHVARLARLRLTGAEVERYATELGRILAYADRLAGLDLAGVPATTHLTAGREDPAPPLRDDRRRPGLAREEALANAPHAAGDRFLVPCVLPSPEEDAG
jgi:aspartyl-tRNA(Asn)/glutamyl-tRNA(Gln) amidotransferase subunit C